MVQTLQQIEREAILASLARNDGDKTKVAEELGVSLKTVYNKIAQYEADPDGHALSLDERFGFMVSRLVKDGQQIASELTGQDARMLHMAIGISGEAGELLDAIKKAVIYRKPLDVVNVVEELGDLEFYMNGLRESLKVARSTCLEQTMQKLAVRYGTSYSDQAAQQRADKA